MCDIDVITYRKDATNGDMIKTVFPNEKIEISELYVFIGENMLLDIDWWNAPYNREED